VWVASSKIKGIQVVDEGVKEGESCSWESSRSRWAAAPRGTVAGLSRPSSRREKSSSHKLFPHFQVSLFTCIGMNIFIDVSSFHAYTGMASDCKKTLEK
jgi:hypothetical protein